MYLSLFIVPVIFDIFNEIWIWCPMLNYYLYVVPRKLNFESVQCKIINLQNWGVQ